MLWWLLKSLVIAVCVVGSNAVLWSYSPGNITACQGDDVTIPWSFTSMPNETVISITWFVKFNVNVFQRNGGVRTLFASLTEGEFFPHSRQHVQFVPSAGLRLQNVTVNDTGLYSVHVSTVDSADNVISYSLSADLNVAAPPVLSGGQLKARRHSAPVLDDVTGVEHVILECGHFIDRGEPPVTVTWRTPSGAVYTNVNYVDGCFLLPLQTVESGSYTCSLTYQSLSRGCLASDSVLLGEAIVYVDENGKWAVREANEGELIAELKSQVQILHQGDQQLKSQVQNLTHNQQILRQENQELKSQFQTLHEEDQELKSQVQNLTHNQQMLNKEDEELKSQVQNLTHNQQILRQENRELKSQVQTLTHNLDIVHQEDEKLKSQDQNLAHRLNQLEKQMINEG
ncbi:hypothetical protein C0Q70_20827 [Pomacea canaliculata]|uniref:Immunoglobulin domain-containing protein n=1 Tax=Pomacea canaliculata TaxID=400727 RepID=A0A2T7NAT7_POMCA|nr:hypothetical protein C0Q70_20827 [Pomacea canaliculata]